MDDRRRDDQRPATTRGVISYGPAGQEVACAVDDLMARGADLRVGSAFGLPQVFRLTIDGEGMARHCRVIRADGRKLGVTFE